MSLTVGVQALIAANVNKSIVGSVAKQLPDEELGAMLAGGCDCPDSATEPVGYELAALNTIYDAFSGQYRRRSLGALAEATGLSPEDVRRLVEAAGDFRVSTGRETGKVYVSIL